MRSFILVLLATLGLCLVQGCADYRMRSAHGLEWYQYNEAQKRELTRQGFDQYSPAM